MKNKVGIKKYLIIISIFILVFILGFITLRNLEYQSYLKETNYKINNLYNFVKDKGISNEDIYDILNDDNYDDNLVSKLGIDLTKENIINNIDREYQIMTYINISLILLLVIIIILIFVYYNKLKDRELDKITKCIKKINNEDYKLELDSYEEGNLAILKSELAKTTLMLKNIANNSVNDKKNLKNYLEDISHQIKTPLTSILINLDNLIDNPNIDNETKDEFLRDIKRDVNNIEFLVLSLLKLSKFDTNTIKYNKEDRLVRDLINNSIDNISSLMDLKNIHIEVEGNRNIKVNCDFKWQVEAITNIIKNAIEYANENSTINIDYDQNKVYTIINIKNIGKAIKKEELKHLFERFYQGNNSTGFGIGLNLAKAIITKDNGSISVTSDDNITTFTIKYFNNML